MSHKPNWSAGATARQVRLGTIEPEWILPIWEISWSLLDCLVDDGQRVYGATITDSASRLIVHFGIWRAATIQEMVSTLEEAINQTAPPAILRAIQPIQGPLEVLYTCAKKHGVLLELAPPADGSLH
ncbi:hypothetical protein [Microvirga tunisiensis]|uniref:Uncharacterized protein n=1 Tax=Microvirga tunisiensis TaxID=2108360 RepID=A0A5N7N383_9HYPH|nr:hypothetical protein [Microvirga tunisiensis]MPR12227.1 hypothetical protein [Microvirga tunisiensis]MPR30156.1 hypothetical protein [Microvirga tunisiensis]